MESSRRTGGTRTAAALLPLACVLALLLAGPSAAGARELDPPAFGPLEPVPGAAPLRDRVIRTGPRAVAAGIGGKVYYTPDGQSVRVAVSGGYDLDVAAVQTFVDFLGSLLHGDEMSRLKVYLATPTEISRICGFGALACYFPGQEEIVVAGEDVPGNLPPRELVIAHEYGHHVAENRDNSPWVAIDRGTKRWFTYEDICHGVRSGAIRPSRYWQNPGEAFAESFAFYHYPDVIPWDWNIAEPDQGAFDAIYADVTDPWRKRTKSTWTGTLGVDARRDRRLLSTPLDGRMEVELDGPRGADFDLRVRAPGRSRVLARAVSTRPDEKLRYTICGRRAVRIEVKAYRGEGPFTITAYTP